LVHHTSVPYSVVERALVGQIKAASQPDERIAVAP
jgi:hypothetical protein